MKKVFLLQIIFLFFHFISFDFLFEFFLKKKNFFFLFFIEIRATLETKLMLSQIFTHILPTAVKHKHFFCNEIFSSYFN